MLEIMLEILQEAMQEIQLEVMLTLILEADANLMLEVVSMIKTHLINVSFLILCYN